jgi:hypothetical protein
MIITCQPVLTRARHLRPFKRPTRQANCPRGSPRRQWHRPLHRPRRPLLSHRHPGPPHLPQRLPFSHRARRSLLGEKIRIPVEETDTEEEDRSGYAPRRVAFTSTASSFMLQGRQDQELSPDGDHLLMFAGSSDILVPTLSCHGAVKPPSAQGLNETRPSVKGFVPVGQELVPVVQGFVPSALMQAQSVRDIKSSLNTSVNKGVISAQGSLPAAQKTRTADRAARGSLPAAQGLLPVVPLAQGLLPEAQRSNSDPAQGSLPAAQKTRTADRAARGSLPAAQGLLPP